jgi:glycosyltransferase involved in cell wall biosynthesis
VKILQIYKDYDPVVGGMENHIRTLAEGMVHRGQDVTVLATSPRRRTQIEELRGVKVIKAGRLATVSSTPVSIDLFLWVRRLKADITHLHFPYPWGEMAHLIFGASQKTIITYHSDVVRQKALLKLYRPLLYRVLTRADRVLATSPQYVDGSPYLRTVRDKCTVIPLGIDLGPFQRPRVEGVKRLRAQYRPPLLLFVGVLRYYKGLGGLIRAMRDLDARLLVVGSGPMASEWRALAHNLGLTDKVFFVGHVEDDELPVYYQSCDLFVLPASHRSEAFGTVQIEAMACGKAVVSTELGTGTSYVNVDGQTGLVVPARDVTALSEAIKRLLADEARRTQMGERGRRRATQEFSSEVMVERVLDVYRSVLQS